MNTEEKNNGPKDYKIPEAKIEGVFNYEPENKGYRPKDIVDTFNPPPVTPTKPSPPSNSNE